MENQQDDLFKPIEKGSDEVFQQEIEKTNFLFKTASKIIDKEGNRNEQAINEELLKEFNDGDFEISSPFKPNIDRELELDRIKEKEEAKLKELQEAAEIEKARQISLSMEAIDDDFINEEELMSIQTKEKFSSDPDDDDLYPFDENESEEDFLDL